MNRTALRLCLAQAESAWKNPELSLKKASVFAECASREGAAIICFPEQFATGWDPASSSFAEDEGGPVSGMYSDIAAESGIGVLGSFREKDGDGFRNTAVFFDEHGKVLSKYSKIHLFSPAGEDKCFSPGSSPSVFEYKGIRFGIAICYDLRFPELFLRYRKLGAECILVPAAWPCSRLSHWDLFLRTRAVENRYYLGGINTIGRTPVDEYCGGSMVISPSGDVIAGPVKEEGLLYADIDPINSEKLPGPDTLSDRRDDLYKSWMQNS
ncbi:carbon-nitrogen hydrolase family protein [Methanolacinia petrolearia]|uniref:carbon-nitrogen hydrolase family protein n=1 Tax=Methanolacinia petrolearia TaxID=54120 RepID=UPI003BABFF31